MSKSEHSIGVADPLVLIQHEWLRVLRYERFLSFVGREYFDAVELPHVRGAGSGVA